MFRDVWEAGQLDLCSRLGKSGESVLLVVCLVEREKIDDLSVYFVTQAGQWRSTRNHDHLPQVVPAQVLAAITSGKFSCDIHGR